MLKHEPDQGIYQEDEIEKEEEEKAPGQGHGASNADAAARGRASRAAPAPAIDLVSLPAVDLAAIRAAKERLSNALGGVAPPQLNGGGVEPAEASSESKLGGRRSENTTGPGSMTSAKSLGRLRQYSLAIARASEITKHKQLGLAQNTQGNGRTNGEGRHRGSKL